MNANFAKGFSKDIASRAAGAPTRILLFRSFSTRGRRLEPAPAKAGDGGVVVLTVRAE